MKAGLFLYTYSMMKRYIVAALVVGVLVYLLFRPWPHPESHEVADFPLIEQPDQITCGPTSAAMLLQKYGKTVTIDEVKAQTKTQWFTHTDKPVGMTSPEYIALAMNHFGVPSQMMQGDINRLKHYVSQNKPSVVLLRSGKLYWHYVVVVGYDENNIIIADPGWGKRRVLPLADFLGAWNFVTDMNGNSTVSVCPMCNGSGSWTDWDLGPLGICPTCDGSGETPDLLAILLQTAEVHPRTMIVPSINTSA